MAIHGETILRERVCRGCQAAFWLCRHCDRGQCYCSPACRQQARREQRRRANRRYQHSYEARLDHRDRQRAYRERRAQRRVTGQSSFFRLLRHHAVVSPNRHPRLRGTTLQSIPSGQPQRPIAGRAASAAAAAAVSWFTREDRAMDRLWLQEWKRHISLLDYLKSHNWEQRQKASGGQRCGRPVFASLPAAGGRT